MRSNVENGLLMPQRVVPDSIPSTSSVTAIQGINEATLNDVEYMTFPMLSQISTSSSETSSESVLAAEEFLMYRRRMLNHINSLENVYLSKLNNFKIMNKRKINCSGWRMTLSLQIIKV